MPIKLNGTTFNNGGTVTFNGQTVKEIKFGTTTVWKAEEVIFDGTNPAAYTGGWEISTEYSSQNRDYSLSGTYLRAGKTSGYGPNQAYMVVSNSVAINVTDYTTATIEYEIVGSSTYGTWAIGVSNTKGQRSGQISGSASVTRRTGTIDISGITGNAYFNLYAYTTGGGISCTTTVYKITLE